MMNVGRNAAEQSARAQQTNALNMGSGQQQTAYAGLGAASSGLGAASSQFGQQLGAYQNQYNTDVGRSPVSRYMGGLGFGAGAEGGEILQPGMDSADQVPGTIDGVEPIRLNHGEHVMTTRATRMLGSPMFDTINELADQAGGGDKDARRGLMKIAHTVAGIGMKAQPRQRAVPNQSSQHERPRGFNLGGLAALMGGGGGGSRPPMQLGATPGHNANVITIQPVGQEGVGAAPMPAPYQAPQRNNSGVNAAKSALMDYISGRQPQGLGANEQVAAEKSYADPSQMYARGGPVQKGFARVKRTYADGGPVLASSLGANGLSSSDNQQLNQWKQRAIYQAPTAAPIAPAPTMASNVSMAPAPPVMPQQPAVPYDPYPNNGAATGGHVMRPKGYAAGGKVKKVMGEFKRGTLHSGSKSGPKVRSREQALAIALSEARKAGESGKARKMGGGGGVRRYNMGGPVRRYQDGGELADPSQNTMTGQLMDFLGNEVWPPVREFAINPMNAGMTLYRSAGLPSPLQVNLPGDEELPAPTGEMINGVDRATVDRNTQVSGFTPGTPGAPRYGSTSGTPAGGGTMSPSQMAARSVVAQEPGHGQESQPTMPIQRGPSSPGRVAPAADVGAATAAGMEQSGGTGVMPAADSGDASAPMPTMKPRQYKPFEWNGWALLLGPRMLPAYLKAKELEHQSQFGKAQFEKGWVEQTANEMSQFGQFVGAMFNDVVQGNAAAANAKLRMPAIQQQLQRWGLENTAFASDGKGGVIMQTPDGPKKFSNAAALKFIAANSGVSQQQEAGMLAQAGQGTVGARAANAASPFKATGLGIANTRTGKYSDTLDPYGKKGGAGAGGMAGLTPAQSLALQKEIRGEIDRHVLQKMGGITNAESSGWATEMTQRAVEMLQGGLVRTPAEAINEVRQVMEQMKAQRLTPKDMRSYLERKYGFGQTAQTPQSYFQQKTAPQAAAR
jgi:hypothetical protein